MDRLKRKLNFRCWFFKAVLKHNGQELLTPLTPGPAAPVQDLGQGLELPTQFLGGPADLE